MKLSQRSKVSPFLAMKMGEWGEQHQLLTGSLLSLNVGQPSSGAPSVAREAAAKAILSAGSLGYTTSYGLLELRSRLVDHYADWYGVELSADRVLVTAGASGAFVVTFLACFDVGDRVGVTSPGYPCYRNDLLALGVEVVDIPVGPETRWAPTPENVAAAGHLDGLIVASPANPTGTVIAPENFERLVRWCEGESIRVISDEIYHGITYGDHRSVSALQFSDHAVVINSFSKYFGMTGWRVGWIAGPLDVLTTCERLQGNLSICAPHISQVAALAAFDAVDELSANVDAFARKRSVLIEGLQRAGIASFSPPDGAFYIYADVSHLIPRVSTDSLELCRRWLDELDLLVTPGLDFDLVRGATTVRFSFAGPLDVLEEACRRLTSWMREIGQ